MERSALTLPQRSLGLSAEPLQGAAVLTTLLRAAKGTASIPASHHPRPCSAVQSPWLPDCRAGTGMARFCLVFFEPGLVLSF